MLPVVLSTILAPAVTLAPFGTDRLPVAVKLKSPSVALDVAKTAAPVCATNTLLGDEKVSVDGADELRLPVPTLDDCEPMLDELPLALSEIDGLNNVTAPPVL